jgi:hypothetical protein
VHDVCFCKSKPCFYGVAARIGSASMLVRLTASYSVCVHLEHHPIPQKKKKGVTPHPTAAAQGSHHKFRR